MGDRSSQGEAPPSKSMNEIGRLHGRVVALCVTGSIAAYKAVELARCLVKAGAQVLPVMTASATRFVGPVTLSGVCGEAVATDMWDASFPGEMHIRIAARADLIVIAPATADVLARLAQGRADDLVTAIALCSRVPVLAAPAMHPHMWDHPATRRNVAELAAQGRVTLVGPVSGEVASGDVGYGRMAEPDAVAAAAVARITDGSTRGGGDPVDLSGVRIVVTAGPTVEDIDPVRFIGNRSSGRMGFAIAERAALRGASVVLIAGPVNLATPPRVRRVDVRGAMDMRSAIWQELGTELAGADALIMTAAVADYRPAQVAAGKIKKGDARIALELVKNPDLLAEVGSARATNQGAARPGHPVLVGFAVETAGGEALVAYARRKLEEKRVDLVVANDAADSFGRDDNRATLVTAAGAEATPAMLKAALAGIVLDRVRALLPASR
jgi:phosphopantothenoylcysteine decarboxylase/phosphopantothenate--cysteine ligase